MYKTTVPSTKDTITKYLSEIEDVKSVKFEIKSDLCIFKQVAEGEILPQLLEIITGSEKIEYPADQKYNTFFRLDFLHQIFDSFRKHSIDISFIEPVEVLECDQKLILRLIRVLFNHIIQQPNEKLMNRNLLDWINYHTNFRQREAKLEFEVVQCSTKELPDTNHEAFNASYSRIDILLECSNFSSDLKDGRIYGLLFTRAFHYCVPTRILADFWDQEDNILRLSYVIKMAKFIGIENIITVDDIISCNITANKMFIARLYNVFHAYNLAGKIKTLQEDLAKCKDHILDLRSTIQALNIQNSIQRESFERSVLNIENILTNHNRAHNAEHLLGSTILGSIRDIQTTLNSDFSFEGESFAEKMWNVYLLNLETIYEYKNNTYELEVKNKRITKKNKTLKDSLSQHLTRKKKSLKEKIIRWFGC